MTVHKSRSAHVLSKERTNREVYRAWLKAQVKSRSPITPRSGVRGMVRVLRKLGSLLWRRGSFQGVRSRRREVWGSGEVCKS